jgi:hypothetical protein
LEETLEADISKLPKTGHFYFALTEKFIEGDGRGKISARQRGRRGREWSEFHVAAAIIWSADVLFVSCEWLFAWFPVLPKDRSGRCHPV